MIIDAVGKMLLAKAKPFTLLMAVLMGLSVSGLPLVDVLMPKHSQPLMCFLFACMAAMYESISADSAVRSAKIDKLSHQMRVQALKGAVNSMYSRFEASGDKWITNEYTIKELAELTDLLKELGVNSYTQSRVIYLNSKVKR